LRAAAAWLEEAAWRSVGVAVDKRAPKPELEWRAWRWLRWYPLAAAALLGLLYWLAPRRAAEPSADEGESEAPVEADEVPAVAGESPAPIEEELEAELEERGWIAERAASAVASALSERVGAGLSALGGRFDREDLKEGGLKAARLAPFVGPFLRYQRARASYASGDAEARAAAERQTVVALAELALDAGVTGVGHFAGDSEGLMHLVEGAVDLADMVDFGLNLQRELGAPLGELTLGKLDDRIDQLAGVALIEIDGLAPFVRSLLTADLPDWRAAVPDEAIPYVEELFARIAPSGSDH
jgi:hypothetical protein